MMHLSGLHGKPSSQTSETLRGNHTLTPSDSQVSLTNKCSGEQCTWKCPLSNVLDVPLLINTIRKDKLLYKSTALDMPATISPEQSTIAGGLPGGKGQPTLFGYPYVCKGDFNLPRQLHSITFLPV